MKSTYLKLLMILSLSLTSMISYGQTYVKVSFNNPNTEECLTSMHESLIHHNYLKLYPNPLQKGNSVNCIINNFTGKVLVKIYDVIGQEVLTQESVIETTKKDLSIDCSHLRSGIYLIHVID